MQIIIKGARVLDPGNIDGKKDIIIHDNIIKAVVDPEDYKFENGDKIIDVSNMIVVPGLIDIHVHLREPGFEYKETIETGLKAAAKGGFTAVCSMPNTNPVNDNAQVTKFIINAAKKSGLSKVYPTGAITNGSMGENLANFSEMKQAGIVAVTDDGKPVENMHIMQEALECCSDLNLPLFVHAEELSLVNGGSMNEGEFSIQQGLKGIPNAAESVMVQRDIELAERTQSSVHFCHISTKESVEAIREAKKQGIKVTCETAPHYFTLTDQDIKNHNTNFKMNPPLRSHEDRKAIIQGLKDGTIDLIASDHAPHSSKDKDVGFDMAAFGIVGLETSFALSMKLVQNKDLTLNELITKMSKNPAKIIGIDNDITPGNIADMTIIDLEKTTIIDPEKFESKSRNTPFAGFKVKGEIYLTMVNGQIVYQND